MPENNYEELFPPIAPSPAPAPATKVYDFKYAVRFTFHKPVIGVFTLGDAAVHLNIPFEEMLNEFQGQLDHLNTVKSRIDRKFKLETFKEEKPFIIVTVEADEAMSEQSIANTLGRLSVSLFSRWGNLTQQYGRLFKLEIVQIN